MSKTRLAELSEVLREAILADPRAPSAIAREAKVGAPTILRFLAGADVYLGTADKLCRELGITPVQSPQRR